MCADTLPAWSAVAAGSPMIRSATTPSHMDSVRTADIVSEIAVTPICAYKVMEGKTCYTMAGRGGDAKKDMSNTCAVVIRGLPFAAACVETYTRACSRPT